MTFGPPCRTSLQPSSNAKQNTMRSLERMSNRLSRSNFKNGFKKPLMKNYIPIDRPCDVIFEEDRKLAVDYSRPEEIDDEIIVSGAGNVPKCYKTWEEANFYPALQNTIKNSGYA
uniref:Uncharacterized protein n=1 Tax=Strongyloides papillosus TaxID=174720 RepID=A0A0N5CBD0_STREA